MFVPTHYKDLSLEIFETGLNVHLDHIGKAIRNYINNLLLRPSYLLQCLVTKQSELLQ